MSRSWMWVKLDVGWPVGRSFMLCYVTGSGCIRVRKGVLAQERKGVCARDGGDRKYLCCSTVQCSRERAASTL